MMAQEHRQKNRARRAASNVKASTWISRDDDEMLDLLRGDISKSLLIRRAVIHYIKEIEAKGGMKDANL
jgi:hypothetical protein